jgi:hypothetical protein
MAGFLEKIVNAVTCRKRRRDELKKNLDEIFG